MGLDGASRPLGVAPRQGRQQPWVVSLEEAGGQRRPLVEGDDDGGTQHQVGEHGAQHAVGRERRQAMVDGQGVGNARRLVAAAVGLDLGLRLPLQLVEHPGLESAARQQGRHFPLHQAAGGEGLAGLLDARRAHPGHLVGTLVDDMLGGQTGQGTPHHRAADAKDLAQRHLRQAGTRRQALAKDRLAYLLDDIGVADALAGADGGLDAGLPGVAHALSLVVIFLAAPSHFSGQMATSCQPSVYRKGLRSASPSPPAPPAPRPPAAPVASDRR